MSLTPERLDSDAGTNWEKELTPADWAEMKANRNRQLVANKLTQLNPDQQALVKPVFQLVTSDIVVAAINSLGVKETSQNRRDEWGNDLYDLIDRQSGQKIGTRQRKIGAPSGNAIEFNQFYANSQLLETVLDKLITIIKR